MTTALLPLILSGCAGLSERWSEYRTDSLRAEGARTDEGLGIPLNHLRKGTYQFSLDPICFSAEQIYGWGSEYTLPHRYSGTFFGDLSNEQNCVLMEDLPNTRKILALAAESYSMTDCAMPKNLPAYYCK